MFPLKFPKKHWNTEEDLQFSTLWSNNSIYGIALLLNRSLSSLHTRATKLGLDRKEGKSCHLSLNKVLKPIKKLDAKLAKGKISESEAKKGFPKNASLDQIIQTLLEYNRKAKVENIKFIFRQVKIDRSKIKICLKCCRPFQSKGKFNRLCKSCKNGYEWKYYNLNDI